MAPRYSTASASDSDAPLPRSLVASPFNSAPSNPPTPAPAHDDDGDQDDDDEDEEAWDEVDIPQAGPSGVQHPVDRSRAAGDEGAADAGGIEIVISRGGQKGKGKDKKKPGTTAKERQERQERHKVHVLCLLAMSMVRNRWLNDQELQARLLSHLPPSLHLAFASITRTKYPNPRDRSRLFEASLKDLVQWWFQAFRVLPHKDLRRRDVGEVEEELRGWEREYDKLVSKEKKSKGKGKEKEGHGEGWKKWPWEEEEQLSEDKRRKRLASQSTSSSKPLVRPFASSSPHGGPAAWEPVHALPSLYAAAAALRGSRDLSAQLFVALLRALDIPARLVVSLQGMEWRSGSASGANKGRRKKDVGGPAIDDDDEEEEEALARTRRKPPPAKGKGKGKSRAVETLELSSSEDGEGGWQDGRGKLNYKIPKPNLRRSAPSGKGGKVAAWRKEREMMRDFDADEDHDLSLPPTQWVEAYSRYVKQWITVDPARGKMRCKSIMEPPKGGGAGNVLAYVVGFEEDGSAHDITPRYARAFNNTTVKLRVPTSSKSKKENEGRDWFAQVLRPYRRKFVLNRDTEEEKELWNRQSNEPFPTSIGGFKNHPNYVLEQHLHRDEALLPSTKSLGLFKGEFPVYPRSRVVVVKSTENWYRVGRTIKPAEVPRKFVKQRAVTINRKRAEEFMKMDGGEVDDQPLYSEDQTEVYVPPPVEDGKVPKNMFGNIDLFVPSMLPEGAVHLPSKVAVKCAKLLGIDYAEATIGFEFRQRRAAPTMAGVVVAAEHADALREAILTLEQSTLEKELAKQQDRVLKRWKKLITGLRIRQRLTNQFKDVEKGIVGEANADTPGLSTTSASASPAPNAFLSVASTSKSKSKTNGTTTSRKRPKPDALPSSSDESSLIPPPRKRLASSTNTNTSPPIRTTRSSTAAATTPATTTGGTAKLSTSGRSLRLRMPATAAPLDPDPEPEPTSTSRRRPTRSSALKAQARFKPQAAAEEEEDEDEFEEVQVGEEAPPPPPPVEVEIEVEAEAGDGGEGGGDESTGLRLRAGEQAEEEEIAGGAEALGEADRSGDRLVARGGTPLDGEGEALEGAGEAEGEGEGEEGAEDVFEYESDF
ncbi:hypothetical protein JCM5296_001306 [Sporobolomyces johnsonii]